ncbi:MAG: hypothetical protein CMC93_00775 [Flavobacteriaceae bacterium]|nr:hypothetical protein [Flavobacteriaceae bacterium]
MKFPKKVSSNKKFSVHLFLFTIVLTLGVWLGEIKILPFLKAQFYLIKDKEFISSILEKNNLQTVYLDIKFDNFKKLEKSRALALKINKRIETQNDFVKAKVTYQNIQMGCKVRLKGDLADHWLGNKFSLRVEMSKGNLLMGMSRFSLQDPVTRNNTNEWLFLNNLREEDCIAVRYKFVNLILNGKSMGIYALEEHFTKELIEHNKRREGVITNFNDNLLWENFYPNSKSNIRWSSIFRSSSPEIRNQKHVNSKEHLKRQGINAFNLMLKIQESKVAASEIFSPEKTAKFLALTRIWNAERGLLFADINFYFNPITCKLEPVGFDGNPMYKTLSPYCYFTHGDIHANWVNFSLSDPTIAEKYIYYLSQFSKQSYLNKFSLKYEKQERQIRRLLKKEKINDAAFEIWRNSINLFENDIWSVLPLRAEKIRQELNNPFPVVSFATVDPENKTLIITVRNVTTQPIEILGVRWNSKLLQYPPSTNLENLTPKKAVENLSDRQLFPAQSVGWDQTNNQKKLTYHLDHLPNLEILNSKPLFLEVRFLGMETDFIKIQTPYIVGQFDWEISPFSGISNFSLPDFISKEEDAFFIYPGTYEISSNIVIGKKLPLIIAPGVTLEFDENSTFVTETPIIARGTADKPILFRAKNKKWPGLLLANSNEASLFNHVHFMNVKGVGKGPNPNGISKNGWTMTGGITINETSADFTNCQFSDFLSEDALNIVSSSFSLDNCYFNNIRSDAFDGDFVKGVVKNCEFLNVSGDGVDFSGSEVRVDDCFFKNIGDKAISVGEGSTVIVSNSIIEDIGFGIVSKDTSVVKVQNSSIKRAEVSGFSVYQKKNAFGPAKMNVINSSVSSSNEVFLVQDGSSAWRDGVPITSIPMDIEDLYSQD